MGFWNILARQVALPGTELARLWLSEPLGQSVLLPLDRRNCRLTLSRKGLPRPFQVMLTH